MNEHGLPLDGLDPVGLGRFHHPGGHGAVHLQVGGGDRHARPIISHDDSPHAFTQIAQIPGNSQNGHDLGRHRNIEVRLHQEAVAAAAHTDDDVPQSLAAIIQNPAHADVGRVDVEPFATRQTQPGFVVVVALVLHARGQSHHGQIVGVHDRVDIAGEAQGILGEGDALGQSAPGGRPLDPHSGAARGLTDGGRGRFAPLGQPLHQADGGGGLALAQRRGGDGRDIHILAVGARGQPCQHSPVVHLAHEFPVGQKLVILKPEFASQAAYGLHTGFRVLRDFPVGKLLGVQHHQASP